MKLSEKDKIFLEKLKALYEENELDVDLRNSGYKYLVLKRNYGDRIERYFSLTRQGVRWRFHRLFNEIYIAAYETIYFIESNFGVGLRPMAFEIVRERVEMRKKDRKTLFFDDYCRQNASSKPNSSDYEL